MKFDVIVVLVKKNPFLMKNFHFLKTLLTVAAAILGIANQQNCRTNGSIFMNCD
jgi:hypothetical protein